MNRHASAFALLLVSLLVLPACAQDAASGKAPAEAKAADGVAAVVAGKPISVAELHEEASSQLMAVQRQEHEILEQTLARMIDDRIVEAEAAERGLEVEALLREEVDAKLSPVTPAQVDAFYEQNKARINQPKDQVAPRISQYLQNQERQALLGTFMTSLREKAGVEILLDPFRVPVESAGWPARGPESAPVTIVEFSDFQCPYCARVNPTLAQLRERYGDKVRIVFRDFPLSFHQEAAKAAEAARCAGEQEKFWEYHDLLFTNQRALGIDKLKEYAGQLGLEQEAFTTCLDSGRHAEAVQADLSAGQMAGVSGTPAFFINGRFLNGAVPLEAFTQVIDDELKRLGVEAGSEG